MAFQLPRIDVSNTWVTQDHIEALKALVPYIDDRTVKRRVKECVLGLTEQLTTELSREAVAISLDEPIAPLTENELQSLNTLMAKGVQHNGLVPALDTLQVGRSLQIMGELLARAHVSTIDFEDQEGLEWVFDMAAEAENGVNRDQVRRLENLVRAGLGLKYRLSFMSPFNSDPA